ncbi:hypothetical protein [Micromonospora lutea]|uniref:LPXTG-motif cell wall anchor domain-containing protein n=1 Tax=Micromonospora lutea TaxID=419825 RepID=A0ABQ4J2S1_9ACTN|nr:hypothetical protein [Micromonospora lutea]GIJ24460.1 hypothetical protein Vlu01_50840 [Micromonospora lutea]
MRVPVLFRRLLALPLAGALVVGALILGVPTPAQADPPRVVLTASCGVAALSWDTGTIGGTETWPTTIRRNDVIIDRFEMTDRGSRRYGAVDGDVFVVRRDGLPDQNLVFRAPGGCTGAAQLTVTAQTECYGVELRLANAGSEPIRGLRLLSPAAPAPEELAPVAPGAATVVLRLADGDNYLLASGGTGSDMVTWFAGTYRVPAGCGPDAVSVAVTDACDGARIELTNRAEGAVLLRVTVDGRTAADRRIAAGARDVFTVPAEPGAEVVVRNLDLDLELARHTRTATPCPPSPSATPTDGGPGTPGTPGTPSTPGTPGTPSAPGTPGTPGGPGDGGSGGDDGGGLPVTGASVAMLVSAGALVVGAGLALLLAARRRRTRFSADG